MTDSEEYTTTEQDLSTLLVEIIKEFPILMEKCQLPQAKEKKYLALQHAKAMVITRTGKYLDEKQILKKLANMKTSVKKKTDIYQTGNQNIILCPWEKELFIIMKGCENPVVMKMLYSTSAGSSTSKSSSSLYSCQASSSAHFHQDATNPKRGPFYEANTLSTMPAPNKGAKRKVLPGETEETINLSTPELQRLLLLEQLKYTRMKIRRLEESQQPTEHVEEL
ncbi:uncharacterized protein [Diadema antillarum]|uniref:uncharacterized protein n=1 Tax=Diadema antillarum TaxID=105358 RepID=UPI003A8C08BD